MMIILRVLILILSFKTTVCLAEKQNYLDRFMNYHDWSQHLPKTPDKAFLTFIDESAPLSKRLREKWLYQLASNKDWITFNKHYQDSTDINLQCYEQLALYQLGQPQKAIEAGKRLWLNGNALPRGCSLLFALLLKNKDINNALIEQRIILALENNQIPLATYLLRQLKPPRLIDVQLLTAIEQNPKRIAQMQAGLLHDAFYLYGLKRLVARDLDLAIKYWQQPKTKQFLNHAEQQSFFVQVALYKAIRNQEDAPKWFSKIQPAYYDDLLLGWEIRYALKYKLWAQVKKLIPYLKDKENPCWQYWLARALEAKGQKEEAKDIYKHLATERHYYGFLASRRLKTALSFSNEPAIHNPQILHLYRPITEQIKRLYLTKQTGEASRLLNDFVSELPKDDKSALLYWLDHDLQWHAKSVYLSNTDELSNQLSLRFPLAYQHAILNHAKQYQIPKELVYAIIRQESAFRDDVISSAGAQGLMQIMPATAKQVCLREKIAYSNKKQLYSTQKNINIGVAYLRQLAKRFGEHPVLMVAAYNAGPKQVVYWLKNHPPKEMDIWIETLPWQETRNYLKNVIAFYAVYQYRMKEKPDLSPFMQAF